MRKKNNVLSIFFSSKSNINIKGKNTIKMYHNFHYRCDRIILIKGCCKFCHWLCFVVVVVVVTTIMLYIYI